MEKKEHPATSPLIPPMRPLTTPTQRSMTLNNLTPNQKSNLKKAAIIGAGGLALGAVLIPLIGFSNGVAESDEVIPRGNESLKIDFPSKAPLFEGKDLDSMSFVDAFNTAREELGLGGYFEWNGKYYNTFKKEEWDSMTQDQKDEFLKTLDQNLLIDSSKNTNSDEITKILKEDTVYDPEANDLVITEESDIYDDINLDNYDEDGEESAYNENDEINLDEYEEDDIDLDNYNDIDNEEIADDNEDDVDSPDDFDSYSNDFENDSDAP